MGAARKYLKGKERGRGKGVVVFFFHTRPFEYHN